MIHVIRSLTSQLNDKHRQETDRRSRSAADEGTTPARKLPIEVRAPVPRTRVPLHVIPGGRLFTRTPGVCKRMTVEGWKVEAGVEGRRKERCCGCRSVLSF